MKAKQLLLLSVILFKTNLFGHEQVVHEAITFNAAESAFDDSPRYASFINLTSFDLPLSGIKSGTNSMRIGSFDEDFGPKEEKLGGYRSLNHFYDPLDTGFGKGLSDSPPDTRSLRGTNSFDWASISNFFGINSWYNPNPQNIWSWPNARYYEWLGLTATNQDERQTNLLNMFRSVGQVLHLLEDASQPQHV